jgi:hypothetical protein
MMSTKHRSIRMNTQMACLIGAAALAFACKDDAGSDDGMDDAAEASSDDGECMTSEAEIPALDESTCTPAAADYTPTINASADDTWPTCENDDGQYHPFEQPSSAARTEAFVMIRSIFANGTDPADFTAAREQYALPEGLESRLVRREDVHYPNIPDDEQDPTVDFDKQCTIPDNLTKYPDRCAGPAKIAPIINDAFAQGQSGTGDPQLHATRIDAALEWFLYLSVIKEATFSCPPAGFSGDCDAAWGYYNGANDRGAPIGYGADVLAQSSVTNERVFDALAAMRCWRNGYSQDEDADTADPLYVAGREQLDRANNHAAALVLRARIADQPMLCGNAAEYNWEWVKVFGQALIKPARDADPSNAEAFIALLDNSAPSPEDIEEGIAALDMLFPCP